MINLFIINYLLYRNREFDFATCHSLIYVICHMSYFKISYAHMFFLYFDKILFVLMKTHLQNVKKKKRHMYRKSLYYYLVQKKLFITLDNHVKLYMAFLIPTFLCFHLMPKNCYVQTGLTKLIGPMTRRGPKSNIYMFSF